MYECRWGAGLWGEVEGAGGALITEAKSAEVGAGGRQTMSPLLGQCWVHPQRGSRRGGAGQGISDAFMWPPGPSLGRPHPPPRPWFSVLFSPADPGQKVITPAGPQTPPFGHPALFPQTQPPRDALGMTLSRWLPCLFPFPVQ